MNKTVIIQNNVGNVYIGDSPEYQINSVINELLMDLAARTFRFERKDRKVPVGAIRKIEYNNIRTNKHVIRQYLEHSAAIEAAYQRIDALTPFGRDVVMRNLNDLYYRCLDILDIDYLGSIDICMIRERSDHIIEFIINELKNFAFESKNVPSMKEHVVQGVNVIVAHAFLECIILEVPKDAAASGV
jgi:hypothetical protein